MPSVPIETSTPDKRCEQRRCFGHGKLRADADPRTTAKRHVLRTRTACLGLRQKAIGIETVCIIPELAVAMDVKLYS
jgi:hypothetical protein